MPDLREPATADRAATATDPVDPVDPAAGAARSADPDPDPEPEPEPGTATATAATATAAAAAARSAGLAAAVDRVLPGARADLEHLVRIPSIWADPAHADDTRRCAEAVAELARADGAARVEIVTAPGGAPAVIAHWPAAQDPASAPTVLLYAHHDVQPTGGDEHWTTPPFEPTERDGRIYGRGAADDKAGVLTHLAVLRSFDGKPPCNVVLFIEGEEESGSPTLTALLAQHRDQLGCDVIVIADSANPAVDVPALTTSLRGLVECVIEVSMLERPVHSGIYGGPVGDALTALCRTLATLHDDKGCVAVPGLRHTHTVAPAPPDLDEAAFRADAGLLDGVALLGTGTIPERAWHGPAVAVLGIDAPRVDEASNVLLPRARAIVSMRLAPGEDPAQAQHALAEHLRVHVPWGAHVEISPGASAAPYELRTDGRNRGGARIDTADVYDIARRTFAQAYGNAAVETGIGGSIPFIAEFARTFPGAAVLVTGVGDPASRWHGIDESLDLGMFGRAVLAEALLLAELAVERNP